MYHEITAKDKRRRRRRIAIALALLAALALIIVGVTHNARMSAREQGAVALRQSIMDAAVRCCAVEGSYPLSLSHLENVYGLRINHHDYVVTYEAYATNMAPSVVVVPR